MDNQHILILLVLLLLSLLLPILLLPQVGKTMLGVWWFQTLSQGVPRLLKIWAIFTQSELRRGIETFFRSLSQLANNNSLFCVSQLELSELDRQTSR